MLEELGVCDDPANGPHDGVAVVAHEVVEKDRDLEVHAVPLVAGRVHDPSELTCEVIVVGHTVVVERLAAEGAVRCVAYLPHDLFGQPQGRVSVLRFLEVEGELQELRDEENGRVLAVPVTELVLLGRLVAIVADRCVADAGDAVVGRDDCGGTALEVSLGREALEVGHNNEWCVHELAPGGELHDRLLRRGKLEGRGPLVHQPPLAGHPCDVRLVALLVPTVEACHTAVANVGRMLSPVRRAVLLVDEPLELGDQEVVPLVEEQLDLLLVRPHGRRGPTQLNEGRAAVIRVNIECALHARLLGGVLAVVAVDIHVNAEVVRRLEGRDVLKVGGAVVWDRAPIEVQDLVLRLPALGSGTSAAGVVDVAPRPARVVARLGAAAHDEGEDA